MKNTVKINRAPVLTLWAAVVAERKGHDWSAALTLGKAVAGLNAQRKGRMIGVFGEPKAPESSAAPRKTGLGEDHWIEICGRPVPAKNTELGVRAVKKDEPIDPQAVQRYLENAFGAMLANVRAAMTSLAAAYQAEEIEAVAYGLYEQFRPAIASGKGGWGQKGDLDLDLINTLGTQGRLR